MKTLLLLPLLIAAAFASEDWPQFRGPTGDGRSDSTGLPLTWSETENVRWKTAIPGEGWSSPVVLGRQVWMTTATEDGHSLRALCADRETGKLLHDVEVFHVAEPPPKNPTNSHASPTPVLEPGRVYVCFGTSGSACLDTATAKVIWKNTELTLDHKEGAGSSPMIYGGLFILHCDGRDVQYVVALDKNTGRIVWKTKRSAPLEPRKPDFRKAYCTPQVITVAGREQLICVGAHRAYAYEPKTGKEIWFCDLPGFSNVPRPLYGHGLLFVGTGFMKPELWAIRADGKGDVSQTHVAWKEPKMAALKSSLALVGDALYMLHDGSGTLTCLNAKTGEQFWQEKLGGSFSASPIFVDGRLYFFNEKGQTTVIKPGRKFEPLATNQLDAGFMATPAVTGKAFIARTKTHLYRIEKSAK